MKFLVAISPTIKQRDSEFHEEMTQLFKGSIKEVTFAHNLNSIVSYAAVDTYSCIWVDWNLLRDDYSQFYDQLQKLKKHVPIVLLQDGFGIDGQLCARHDSLFSIVPFDMLFEQLPTIINRLKLYEKLVSEIPKKSEVQLRPNGFGPFIGNSLPMLEVYRQIVKVAQSDFTVMITGGSGSGKELVAQSIHDMSPRKNKRFVSINCSAIPENLLESELFGYEKGAFTDASQPKAGKFELAHEGTIFLDEIGDMPSHLQAKLLRVLEDHTIERLGGTEVKKVDLRLLAATHQDISSLIQDGKFRSDLHYRLNVIQIHLPSLNMRGDDILLISLYYFGKLINKGASKVSAISKNLIKKLQTMAVAGNVRELENILTRVLFNAKSAYLSEKLLQDSAHVINIGRETDENSTNVEKGVLPLWQVEKHSIEHALKEYGENISRMAEKLEISRTALYRKMKKYQLDGKNSE